MKPDKDSKLTPGQAKLLEAAHSGDVQEVKRLLQAGVDPDVKDDRFAPWDVTPLMRAARAGHVAVVRALLDAGARVKARDKHFPGEPAGYTALHYAVMKRHMEVARLLVDAGADVNAVGTGGAGSVLQAAINDPDIEVRLGTAPDGSVYGPDATEKRAAHEFVRFLLSAGADPNREDRQRKDTVLFSAASDGLVDVVEALLDGGADLNHQDSEGGTAFSMAAVFKRVEVGLLLLARGFNVNLRDESGWTALHWAAHSDEPRLVEAVLQKGAKLTATNEEGKTPLDIAVRDGCARAQRVLRQRTR